MSHWRQRSYNNDWRCRIGLSMEYNGSGPAMKRSIRRIDIR
jgi:hypothetical protein